MIKIRQLLAAYIGFWLYIVPGNILLIIFQPNSYIFIDIFNVIFAVFPFVVCITLLVFKDTVLKNRSIGKKIMGLYIYDQDNQIIQHKDVLIQKNFYKLWLFPVSGFLISLCNQSIGDQQYCTVVSTKNV